MPVRFDHKIVLVTGATSGLGRDAAIAFAAAGAKVVATGRRPDAGAETLRRMREAGGEGIFIAADLGRPEEAERVVAAAVETFGGLDVAYNVAGIPLAALGYLNPMMAGAAMALSSVSVMANALLLKRWKP